MIVKGRVGKKGELFPPKELRKVIGLESGTEVIYRLDLEKKRLIVEPIPNLVEFLDLPKFGEVTVREFHKDRKKMYGELVER
jgi:bifunctional DNA-binding transcriptional regulator/antitoxin component of YhaV-PrlF toxin-antitoxin module